MSLVLSWSTQLDGWAPTATQVLLPWLPRLEAWLGPPRVAARHLPGGQPDGLDGLDRRGPPERLLLSEWALAEEAPDEFLRRGAQSEWLYRRLALRQPAQAPEVLAWLDWGPDQLGAPRLAQLAILLLLRRRALAARGRLRWSALQAPEAWFSDLDAAALAAWRSGPSASAPELPADPPEGQRWILGGPQVVPLATALGAQRVVLSEHPDPERRELLLERPGRPPLSLLLPPSSVLAQAMASPLRTPSAPRPPPPPAGALEFLPAGRDRVWLLDRTRARLLACPDRVVPWTRARVLRTELRENPIGTLIGLGQVRNRGVSLRRDPSGALWTDAFSRAAPVDFPGVARPRSGPGSTNPSAVFVLPRKDSLGQDQERLLWADAAQQLWLFDWRQQAAHLLDRGVTGLQVVLLEGQLAPVWTSADGSVRLLLRRDRRDSAGQVLADLQPARVQGLTALENVRIHGERWTTWSGDGWASGPLSLEKDVPLLDRQPATPLPLRPLPPGRIALGPVPKRSGVWTLERETGKLVAEPVGYPRLQPPPGLERWVMTEDTLWGIGPTLLVAWRDPLQTVSPQLQAPWTEAVP